MKSLEVSSLNKGIDETLHEIENVRSHVTEVQKGVRGIIDLDSYLKGKTGESIRSFFETIHGPFLIYLYQSLIHYTQALEKLQQAVYSYEPNENGLVREDFMDNDVQNGLDKAEKVTAALVEEANGIIASVSDLVSIPNVDMEEFGSAVQKGKSKVKNHIEQLYDLDSQQTKSLSKVGEDLELMNQYISEMARTFSQDYSIISFNELTALKLTTLPTILKDVYGEPVPEEKEADSLWDNIIEGTATFAKGAGNTIKGTAIGVYDVGADTLGGLYDTVTNPINTLESMGHMVAHPIKTSKYIGNAIEESYERDMVNGNAESRAHWVTYSLGTIVTSVVGTKGAGMVTKGAGTATKAGVAGVKKTGGKIKNIDLSDLLPYTPQYQVVAGGAKVPYNVVDGNYLKDQLIWKMKVFVGNPRIRLPRTNGKWQGEPGNGKWFTENADALKVTKGEPVEFKNNRPDFSPWSKGQLKFKEGQLNGSASDFKLVYKKIMKAKGFSSLSQAKNWLREKGLTPHHVDSNNIQLIPTKLHRNVPHIGSASDLRGGY
ncbi:T7SS effector LXG polymorphic toxin [Lentibacillus sp. Marseille-P4043]|uniref:T7SS effector LXG polymorphic toxin n=1 Tax=Lentibacillus sp. Marseille-P4043 TaxID=2040293 RepID=UPI000D0AD3BB|nr:T7SS effector LXG polymorphic toxin [Lentibacillus sp. Marseille-P4043]